MLMQAYNAVGSNTPGAASSAADFGWILGRVWEAKIVNFRTFFDVLARSFFERDSKGEKTAEMSQQDAESANL